MTVVVGRRSAWFVAILWASLSVGCGRVGLELLPIDDDATDEGSEDDIDLPYAAETADDEEDASSLDRPDASVADRTDVLFEDAPSQNGCDTAPKFYEAGAHPRISVPTGCTRVTAELWGGGGGTGGKTQSQASGVAGHGGAGGYASSTINVSGMLDLYVGRGAAGCGADSGGSSELRGYHGGAGGTGDASGPREGQPGGDGVVIGGGAGGTGSISNGGRGHYGGGGGGSGWRLFAPLNGGGGGAGAAASVLLVDGTALVIAGGGGGSGGLNGSTVGSTTSPGGQGCSGAGGSGTAGGGGGGMCRGDVTQPAPTEVPYKSESIPVGRARGGAQGVECAAGGDGYAILTFAP